MFANKFNVALAAMKSRCRCNDRQLPDPSLELHAPRISVPDSSVRLSAVHYIDVKITQMYTQESVRQVKQSHSAQLPEKVPTMSAVRMPKN
jgi:hypothetical protein